MTVNDLTVQQLVSEVRKTTQEVADILGIDRRTVRTWMTDGVRLRSGEVVRLEGIQLPRKKLTTLDAVNRFIVRVRGQYVSHVGVTQAEPVAC